VCSSGLNTLASNVGGSAATFSSDVAAGGTRGGAQPVRWHDGALNLAVLLPIQVSSSLSGANDKAPPP
jgi:hypothetical protein